MTNQEQDTEKGGWSVTKIISYIIIGLGAILAVVLGVILISHALGAAVILAWLGLPVWVYYDARSRGMDKPLLWAVLVLFSFFIGLLVYLIVRPEKVAGNICPECKRIIKPSFAMCPYCGHNLRSSSAVCPSCGREIDAQWKYCPYCRQSITENSQQA